MKQLKNIFIILMFLLCSSISFGITPFATEDFQDLSLGFNYSDLLINDFACSNSNCYLTTGAGTGTGGVLVENNGLNKYITIYSLGGNSGNNKAGHLYYNYSVQNQFVMNNDDFSISFDMRVNNYPSIPSDTTPFVFAPVANEKTFATFLSCSDPPFSSVCGITYNNDEDLDNINYDYGITSAFSSSGFLPLDTSTIPEFTWGNCFLDSSIWYNMVLRYHITKFATNDNRITNVTIYQNGNQCFDWDIPTARTITRVDTYFLRALRFYSEVSSVSYDNFKLYANYTDDLLGVSPSSLANCPLGDCVFYDDYDINPINNSYVYPIIANVPSKVKDSIFYFGNEGYNQFNTYEFEQYSDNLKMTYEFAINATPNPITDIPIFYQFKGICKDTNAIVNNMGVFVNSYDTPNQTLISFYHIDNDGITQTNTIANSVYVNGEHPIIQVSYNFETQKVKYSLYDVDLNFYSSLTSNGYLETDFLNDCDNIDNIYIDRADVGGAVDYGFFGIEKIYAQHYLTPDGLDYPYLPIENPDFYTDNNLTPPNSSMKTIDENLHDFAWTLGFRSVGAKVLFWLLLAVIIIIFTNEALDIQSGLRNYLIGGMFLILFVTGWYLSFIPPALFIFFVLVGSIIIAFFFQQKFTGG
jgi:hypothetical protein